MIGPDELFLEALRELDRLEASHTDYDCLAIARILRQLTLDDHPLIHQVNRPHRLKLTFRVNYDMPGAAKLIRGPSGTTIHAAKHVAMGDTLDPERVNLPVKSTLTMEKLLKRPVATARDGNVTALELIKFGANVAGGVHAGSPSTEQEKAIEEFASAVTYKRYVRRPEDQEFISGALVTLRALGRIVRRGLTPLEEAVLAERGRAPR